MATQYTLVCSVQRLEAVMVSDADQPYMHMVVVIDEDTAMDALYQWLDQGLSIDKVRELCTNAVRRKKESP